MCPAEIAQLADATAWHELQADRRAALSGWVADRCARMDKLPPARRVLAWLFDGEPLLDEPTADDVESAMEEGFRRHGGIDRTEVTDG